MAELPGAIADAAPSRAGAAGVLHHVGFAVRSIAESGAGFARSIGADWDGVIVHDPAQRARVSFIRVPGAGPAIELIEPDSPDAPLAAFVSRGGGLHHVCYEVESLDAQLAASRTSGGLVAKRPAPAVAFGGRRIAWVYTKERLLVEYLER